MSVVTVVDELGWSCSSSHVCAVSQNMFIILRRSPGGRKKKKITGVECMCGSVFVI